MNKFKHKPTEGNNLPETVLKDFFQSVVVLALTELMKRLQKPYVRLEQANQNIIGGEG